MSEAPATVEIAIPYVGSPDYLRLAVESVLGQTDPDWTLFVLVDGPEQPPVEAWLDSLADPRIRHERSHTNVGVAASFQRCLEAGTSSHVTILGCDDQLFPCYVEVVRRAVHAHPGCFAVLPAVRVIDDAGNEVTPLADRIKSSLAPRRRASTRVIGGQRLLVSLLLGNWTYFPLTCWDRRRARLHGFRQELSVALDLALWAALALEGGRLALPSELAGSYRRHSASVSSATAVDLTRFAEEAAVHREIAAAARDRRWGLTALLARIRLTSRLHAMILLLSAARRRDAAAARGFLRYVVA